MVTTSDLLHGRIRLRHSSDGVIIGPIAFVKGLVTGGDHFRRDADAVDHFGFVLG